MAERDETGRSRTTPMPELNPLLNPLLNKHLGRWAEVYFKCPPERRDEAVMELLQELEIEDSGMSDDIPHNFRELDEVPRSEATAFFTEALPLVCQSCEFPARPNQKFCGRCGARLVPASNSAFESPAPQEVTSERVPLFSEPAIPAYPSSPEPESNRILETESTVLPDFVSVQESEPVWHSYRFYIAALFAIGIVALGYLAWHSSQAGSQAAKLPEQAPTPAASAPNPANPPPEATHPEPTAAARPTASPTSLHSSEDTEENSTVEETKSELSTPAVSENKTEEIQDTTNSPYGAQELATARSYLDGTGGKQADDAQGAEWLWKAVAKQNTTATLMLGRLYLRGDGVPKNCEQGRILLDAAAKKGNKDAATLLQNLQAFGCR